MTWKAGVELPPFTQDNPAMISFLVGLAAGELEPPSPIAITNAIAVQIWWLVIDDERAAPQLRSVRWSGVYRILHSLSLGAIAPVPDATAVNRLRKWLDRDKRQFQGIVHAFRHTIKFRDRDGNEVAGMSLSDATRHLLLSYDRAPLDFAFPAPAPEASGGGGGDDPDDPTPADQPDPAVPSAAPPRQLDIRTRTMEAALQLRAIAGAAERRRLGWQLTWWRQLGGALPDDALRMIDAHVRGTRLAQARREETFELQSIRLREQVDLLRGEKAELEAQARASLLKAERAARQRDAAISDAAAKLAAAEATARDAAVDAAKEQRDRLRAANDNYLARKRELEQERVFAEEAVTRVEVMNTELDRQLVRARAALRASAKEAAAAEADLERERDKQREGRAWACVREERVRRGRAEEESARLRAEVDSLIGEASGRSRQHAAEKEQLKYLRHRVKVLEEKVASYEVKANRKFFEVEPVVEENDRLRGKIDAQVLPLRPC